MFDQVEEIFKKKNILSHKNQGITFASVADSNAGIELTKDILYKIVDRRTVLYLSGGSTPKTLYAKLAEEEVLMPGTIGQVDERYGEPLHPTSNQLMIKGTGLTRYLEIRNIPFHQILQGKSREETASDSDEKMRELNSVFQRSIAIMGIGGDGHTSGIAPNRKDFANPVFDESRKNLLFSEFDDPTGMFKERVTMTFLGLEMVDLLILLVFGADKKEALDLMFGDGSEQEIPARFYKRPEIAQKTLLITDQKV